MTRGRPVAWAAALLVAVPAAATAAERPPVTRAGAITHVRLSAGGEILDTAIALPPGWRRGRPCPVLLALPPGGQGTDLVDALMDRYWSGLSRSRGWVVVSPAAPGGALFHTPRGARTLPALLARVRGWYPPEGGRFHLAGVSNGGLSAFRLALDRPGLLRSLLVFPGFPPEPSDTALVPRLARIPVLLVGGERDTYWVDRMRRVRDALRRAGGTVTLRISPGEDHILRNVRPAVFYDFLDAARPRR